MTCPHGMPSAAACVDCMYDGPVAVEVVVDRGDWAGVADGDQASRRAVGPLARTVASIESTCEECGFTIDVGDPIALAEEGGPWIHERCWR